MRTVVGIAKARPYYGTYAIFSDNVRTVTVRVHHFAVTLTSFHERKYLLEFGRKSISKHSIVYMHI